MKTAGKYRLILYCTILMACLSIPIFAGSACTCWMCSSPDCHGCVDFSPKCAYEGCPVASGNTVGCCVFRWHGSGLHGCAGSQTCENSYQVLTCKCCVDVQVKTVGLCTCPPKNYCAQYKGDYTGSCTGTVSCNCGLPRCPMDTGCRKCNRITDKNGACGK
jgi:hypothetical protein